MKILKLDGFKYSQEPFDNYKFRAKVEVQTFSGRQFILDVYTTNPNLDEIPDVLVSNKTEDVLSLVIIGWTAKKDSEPIFKLF